ncbi:MAG: bifunctional phosphopantothenoylcysteine decarboxylase/phosphopantothenate--cysteine ligase CoaBC, partial [Lautropia sp.]|nr:bifunctional phosphopantothenoylcysteine decarboxylase/phosphopantothenate--cysteine ligase CoaBC [Lautropia sp.]
MLATGDRLAGRSLLLGVSGGVAAYKSAQLVRDLQRAGATVRVVMTAAAAHFVAPTTFQALTGQPVYLDQWDERVGNGMAHIELSRGVDAIVIAPATADLMAKIAQGLADDLLSTLCLAREAPLLVAPAMNRQMWGSRATQRNVAQLRADGVAILGPGNGDQACGEVGDGRMLEPLEIVEELAAYFAAKVMSGKRVLITAGPTFEAIDPVRGITNRSSGKMGYALARACRYAGAQVILVSGPTALDAPPGVKRINVQSALQMMAAVDAELDLAASSIRIDCFIAVAAVADWRVANPSPGKIKKHADAPGAASQSEAAADKPPKRQATPTLELVENPDILVSVARRVDGPYCVGFAAESENLVRNAQQKRLRKGVPLIVGNIGPDTFGRDENELV